MALAEQAYVNEAADEDFRNALVMGELDQVYYIASRIRERLPQQVELEDLVNAGVIGLLEASKSFDSSKNTHFRSYAKFRIRGAIMDSLRESDWGSRSLRKRTREIAEATAVLSSRLGRQPVESEIAAEMGWTTKRFQSIVAQIDGLFIAGQQAAVSGDGEHLVDLVESAPDLDDPDPFDLCLTGERNQHLAEAISKLTEREQLILSLYYREELTMKEIAQIVGVALSRVSQIRQAALIKLREYLGHLEERTCVGSVPIAGCDLHA
jgi:RNA polymerase sigma factor for flagellar operon FliA